MPMRSIVISCFLLVISSAVYTQARVPIDSVMAKVAKGKMYTLVFLKAGKSIPKKSQSAQQMQMDHLTHLFTLEKEGKISVFGPVMNDAKLKGIIVFNSTDQEYIKKELSNDPYIKAGILKYELLNWFSIPGQRIPN